jgi:hypothetical protein
MRDSLIVGLIRAERCRAITAWQIESARRRPVRRAIAALTRSLPLLSAVNGPWHRARVALSHRRSTGDSANQSLPPPAS